MTIFERLSFSLKVWRYSKSVVMFWLNYPPTDSSDRSKYAITPEIHEQGSTLSLAYRSLMDPKHLPHQLMVDSTTAHKKRLRSRYPFVHAARKLLNKLSKLGFRGAQLTNYKWNMKYTEDQSEIKVTPLCP